MKVDVLNSLVAVTHKITFYPTGNVEWNTNTINFGREIMTLYFPFREMVIVITGRRAIFEFKMEGKTVEI